MSGSSRAGRGYKGVYWVPVGLAPSMPAGAEESQPWLLFYFSSPYF